MSQAAAQPEQVKPLIDEQGPIVLVGFFAMVFGMFMAVLDIQIVSASLPQIQAGLSASAEEVSWVQTSYLIAEVVMIPLASYLSRMLSTRVLFATAAAGFTFASFMCGFATTIEEMMVWRAMQGFIGGAMIPTTFATSYLVFGTARRGQASAIVGLVVTLAPTIGPTLGGYITDWLGWHWLFFVNVIPGILITATVWIAMDIDRPDRRLWKELDFFGLALLAIFLGTFQYVLEEGAKNDWFADGEIRLLAVTAVVSGGVFMWRMLHHRNPIVDLSPFKNRNFSISCTLAFAVGLGLFGITYLLPLYLGRVQQFSSLQAGEWLWVTGLFMFISSPIVGRLANYFDLRILALIGFAMLTAASWLFTPITTETGFWELFVPQALRGSGLITSMLAVQTMAMQAVSPQQLKGSAGLFNLTRNTGGAFGLAVLNTQLADRTNLHWARLRESLQPGDPQTSVFLEGFAARYADFHAGAADQAALKILGQLTFQQSMLMAFSDLFFILTLVFAGTAVMMLFLSKPVNRLAQEMH